MQKMYEGELGFTALSGSQALSGGQAGPGQDLTSRAWRGHLKCRSPCSVPLQILLLNKQEFSTASQESFTFHVPHYQHIPS